MGEHRVKVNTFIMKNDMMNFKDMNDVLTALIHLGYVAYDEDKKEVYLPNREIRQIFERTLKATKWSNVIHAIEQSERLLRATIAGDEVVKRGANMHPF